jgi:peptidoglycan/xylan/chitin deacetylase (PgdA/CDA1 family)
VQLTLCYHRIDDSSHPVNESSVSAKQFDSHLRTLRRFFEIVDLQELKVHSRKPRVAITFDDGYHDNLVAAEILEKFQVPATFFLSTYFIEKQIPYYWDLLSILESKDLLSKMTNQLYALPRYLRSDTKGITAKEVTRAISVLRKEDRIMAINKLDQLTGTLITARELVSLGKPMKVEDAKQIATSQLLHIAAHTETHPSLGEDLVESDLSTEIQVSINKISQWSKKQNVDFALPFGTELDWTGRTVSILDATGIKRIWTTEAKKIDKSHSNVLPRLVVGNWKSDELVRQIARTFVRSQLK